MERRYSTLAVGLIFAALFAILVSCTGSAPAREVGSSPHVAVLQPDSIPGWPQGMSEVTIISTYDQTSQPALFWAPPEGRGPRPLLVALHTWSGDYLQDASVPYWEYCREKDWVFVHPNFRGPNNNPLAAGSPAATEDIFDAVAFARQEARVDTSRIYLVGASGGGHMALLTAGRGPGLWAAVSAWVPVTDLTVMYSDFEGHEKQEKFQGDLRGACGGAPGQGEEIDRQYRLRSPLSVLAHAAGVPVEISSGIHDGHDGRPVPIRHSLLAFNTLAEANGMPDKKLTPGQIDTLVICERVPVELTPEAENDTSYGDRTVLFRRCAGPARITIFEGGHEKLARAALEWLAGHRKNSH